MPSILYDKFEMPQGIKVDEKATTSTFARFIAEPLERGFAHTLGNSLRRILLTSIEAPGIVSLFMEGVHHEYMAVEGIIEDVTNIVLNLKGALLRRLPLDEIPHSRGIKSIVTVIEVTADDLRDKGQKVITLGDLITTGDFEVVNPELPIFTVTKPMKRRIEIKVAIGRGYVPSERHENLEKSEINEIVVDTAFSPVRLVNYYVENTRVGQDTDFDSMMLEVTTDGRISPKEALAFSAKILSNHLDVFENMEEYEIVFEEVVAKSDTDRDELMQKLMLGINEIELSVRSTNCLNGADIETIGELVVMSEPKLLQFRNFGKKSLNEIKAKLYEMSLSLGMDLSRFGITQENAKEMMKQQIETHQQQNNGANV